MELIDLIRADYLNLLREAREIMVAEGWKNFPEPTEDNIVVYSEDEVYFSFNEDNAPGLFIGSLSTGTSTINPVFVKRIQEVVKEIKRQKISTFGQKEETNDQPTENNRF